MVDSNDSGPARPGTGAGRSDTARRILGYGIGAVLVAGLSWAACYERPADAGTLLYMAKTQLGFAYSIPGTDKDGQLLSERQAMLADVEHCLDLVEEQEPGMTSTAELRAFLHQVRGETAAAAAAYRRIRTGMDCPPEQLQVVTFQEARLLRDSGDPEGALEVLDGATRSFPRDLRDRAAVMRAEILFGLGRDPEARQLLQPLITAAGERPMPSVWAGRVLQQGGQLDAAEAAFAGATGVPEGAFQLARLKLDQGEVDTAIELLVRARAGFPDRIPVLLRKDRDHWVELAGAERVEQLLNSPGEPAGPVR